MYSLKTQKNPHKKYHYHDPEKFSTKTPFSTLQAYDFYLFDCITLEKENIKIDYNLETELLYNSHHFSIFYPT